MITDFKIMPSHARVWIYQSVSPLAPIQVDIIRQKLNSFIDSWESHGEKILGSWNILHDHFIVITVDEDAKSASGCSIDKSVNVIKEIEDQLGISLTDRSLIPVNNKNNLTFIKFNEIKKQISAGSINEDSLVFNNNVTSLKELNEQWILPSRKSWISKFFNN